jgi:Tfp pilus assembly protein PilZ
MYEELRKYPRASLKTELWIGQDGIFTRTDEFLSDLSIGGAFVETHQVFPVGSILNLRFKMPSVTNMVTCTAIVRNMILGSGLGVEFLDLARESRRYVEEFVETTLSQNDA